MLTTRSIVPYLHLLMFMTTHCLGQGVMFSESSWDEALQRAAQEQKLIFIDVYTDWCAPCKKMDQTTFASSKVSTYFNSAFLSLKANAEDQSTGSFIAKRYDVSVYPTLLFVDNHGRLITSASGMQTEVELLQLAQQAQSLLGNLSQLSDIQWDDLESYTIEELRHILNASIYHHFEGKELLAMRYLDQIDPISEEDLRIVINEISRMELPYLKRLTPLTTSLSYGEMSLRRNAKEWFSWKQATETAIQQRIDGAIENANFDQFQAVINIIRDNSPIKPKEIDRYYIKYYRRNDLNQYRTFATYLITEYIIPTRPAEVANADRVKYKLLHEEVSKDFAALAATVNVDFGIDSRSSTPTIDSLANIFTISRSIADQLYEISSDFYAFYDDESSRRKALFWASLAYQYYPYEIKYFDNHAYILENSGQLLKAQRVRKEMQALPWYQEMKLKVQLQQSY